MSFALIRSACLLVVAVVVPLFAAQVEPRILISPIVKRPFEAVVLAIGPSGQGLLPSDDVVADMGVDEDSCRHSSGVSEYDHYVITCPHSYFTALSVEWDRQGNFRGHLPQSVIDWMLGPQGFHGEWTIDKRRLYERAARQARARGQRIPAQAEWVMPQDQIPLDKRYRLALTTYQQRQATDGFAGRVALSGAWALRVRLNRPFVHSALAGGIEEVNERVQRFVKPNESFDRDAWIDRYRQVWSAAGRLTPEGAFVCGTALHGLYLRQGDRAAADEVLAQLERRFADKPEFTTMRGLITERRRLTDEYHGFLSIAINHIVRALAAEEFPRPRIPDLMFVVAESFRRLGEHERAYDWFLTLAKLDETQSHSRMEIREMGRVPAVDAPWFMLLGWRADDALRALEANGIQARESVSASDRALLDAIRFEGLGTGEYQAVGWIPRSGAPVAELEGMLAEIGKSVLEFRERADAWPEQLDELWARGLIRDRNRFNRFRCPVTGAPLAYAAPPAATIARPELVVVATTAPVAREGGPRYAAWLAGLRLVWSEQPIQPGSIWQAP